MAGLGMHHPDTMTWAHLHEAVDQIVSAQCITDYRSPC